MRRLVVQMLGRSSLRPEGRASVQRPARGSIGYTPREVQIVGFGAENLGSADVSSGSSYLIAKLKLALHQGVCRFRDTIMKFSLSSTNLICTLFTLSAGAAPLALHPENPRYFLYHGKPLVVVTSGEHYGAVLNLDFDYVKYLATLAGDGLNGTRTWAGAYCEPHTAFNIAQNTLAPAPGRFICPWARSAQPGYANGGNKFDLTKWDPGYFRRLKDFMSQASKRGIIVELNLFCPFYEESMWSLSPMNAYNNINGIGGVARTNVYTLDKNDGLLPVQEQMVRKLAAELKGFDNFYFEICNEPYFGGVTLEWQRHIAATIQQAEPGKRRHLISQNIANYKEQVVNPDPAVSIFNFHYATPPETVALNYGLSRVIGENETGFRGTNDSQYRMEGWDFLVAGGGLFNNLDYSFTAGRENGTFIFPENQPGCGSAGLRRQYGYLKHLLEGFDFIHMRPDNEAVQAELPKAASVRALGKPGQQYLVYIRTGLGDWKKAMERKAAFNAGEVSLKLELAKGAFAAEWLDTKKCASVERVAFEHNGGWRTLAVPAFEEDIALTVRRR
ncbi:MAG TPA: hypothetical protein VFE51_22565 [Verrucomicrobiae bacterium]|nr:hypothetical protein [Verrucomicrobiae bacterium]